MTDQENQPVSMDGEISPEEMARLEAELQTITPEGLFEMERTMEALSNAVTLPEAGGIVFTEFINQHGSVINVTSRAATAVQAINGLVDAARRLKSLGYNVRRGRVAHGDSQAPAQTQPTEAVTYTDVDAGGNEVPSGGTVIDVTSYARAATRDGRPYLRVFGGIYTKFGVPAYEQAIPTGVAFDINTIPTVPQTTVPDWMFRAEVTPSKPLKVVRFIHKSMA